MQEDILVEVNKVSKKFCKNLKRSLWYGAKELAADFMGIAQDKSALRKDEFWAVKDISFQLRRGECLGLIGHNGAGKSTLLKMLNGLIRPDEGEIRMRGRVGALIELGAGFNPVLTGRENVYVNGQILGFSKKEINQKFEAIVDFAEIGDFIDSPVQNYSSGMKVRLGFAVAAQMEPDILIIDEVLAVGDAAFRAKCYDILGHLLKKSAVIFVSHAMTAVARICNRTILMNKGRALYFDTTEEGIKAYYDSLTYKSSSVVQHSTSGIALRNFEVNSATDSVVQYGEAVNVKIDLEITDSLPFSSLIFEINYLTQEQIFFGVSTNKYIEINFDSQHEREVSIEFTSDRILFTPGEYHIGLAIFGDTKKNLILWIQGGYSFKVLGDYHVNAPVNVEGTWSKKNKKNVKLLQ